MTTELALYSKIISLPPDLKEEVLKYVNYLLTQEKTARAIEIRKIPKAGFSKIKYTISQDFDAPLEDFKEYMD